MAMIDISVQIDEDLKKQAEALLAKIGLDISSAITFFLEAVVDHQGIFFIAKERENKEREIIAKSLFWVLSDDMTLEESKEERLNTI